MEATARQTARPRATVARVPAVTSPTETAPSQYDHPTSEDAACGGDVIAPAVTTFFPGTTTRTPKALADG